MANVMQKSIQIDDENLAKEQELLARLITENKVRNSLQTDIYIISSFLVEQPHKILCFPVQTELGNIFFLQFLALQNCKSFSQTMIPVNLDILVMKLFHSVESSVFSVTQILCEIKIR